MKKFIFIIISLFFVSSGIIAQKAKEYSQFVDFEQLGIQKKQFVNQFGKPTSKDMAYDRENNLIETFLYKEDLEKGKTIIITRFTFTNDKLIEQKSEIISVQIDEKLIEQILSDLTFIKHRVQLYLK